MLLQEAIQKRIKQLLDERNMSVWNLYKSTGVPKSSLFAILNGATKDPKQSTILHICQGLNISLKDFYNSDIFNNIDDE